MEFIPFPAKKYNIIYADPPWEYRDKAGKRGAHTHYNIPSTQWLKELPVQSIAAKNCALFIWVPIPLLNKCWSIIEKWGFKYRTGAFVWIKHNKNKKSLFWGMGSYTRSNAELCLLASKGKIKRVSAKVHSVVNAPMVGHSKKPPEVRERIVQLLGDLPRIELFAREIPEGWDVWGDEIQGGFNGNCEM